MWMGEFMRLAIVVAAVMLVLPATGFEYSGLRSGMTLEQAQAALTGGGYEPLSPVRNMDGLFTIGQPSTSTTNVTFCGDVLFAVTAQVAGGVDAYTQMALELTNRYGQPLLQPMQEYTEKGLLSSMRLTWTIEAGEEAAVDLTSYQERVSATRSFSAFRALCPQPAN